MRFNPRFLLVAVCVSGLSAGALAAEPKKAESKEPASAGEKKGEATVADQKKTGFLKKKKEVKKEEKKPARFGTDFSEGVAVDAKADQKRDEQIDQLKKIIPKVQGAQKADLLFQLAELWWEKSKFVAYKGIAKYDEALAKWMEKTNKGEQAGPEPKFEQYVREGELYRQEALRKYEEILKEFPTYERKDEVLFAFAYNKYETGQKEEAIAKYNELIKQYPQSRFVPDAYVQMGEHFFATNQLSKARTAFEKALASNNAKIKYFAIYKLAWCDFNAGAYEEAIKRFKDVIANAKVEKGGTGLKTEALNDIVTAFAQVDAVDEAITYFKKNTGKDNARRLIAKLADQYQTAGKHDAGIKTFRTLISDDPNDPRCPEYQNSIIVSFEGLRRRDQVAKEMERLVELYRPNTPWAKANAANKAAIDTAYEITEGALRTMVTEYHQEAQKTKAVETYRLARDIYKKYLDSFADSEFAYNLRYYYADILWALNEFEAAALQYGQVVDKDVKGQYSKMAAFNAVLCYEKLVDAEKKGRKIEELKEGQKIDEKKVKGGVAKTTVKLVTHDKDSKAEEIPKWEQRLVESIDKSVNTYPGEADEITLRYKAAFVFYDHKHDVDAARRFGEIIIKWPTDQYSRKAADLTLNILETKEQWLDLNKLAREFAGNAKLVGNDKDFGTRIGDLVEASQYKYIDETVYKAQKDPAQAAVKYREFVAEFPKSKYSAQALLYAMIIHQEASQLDLSIEDGEKLLKEYPEGKGVDGRDVVGRTLLYLGSFYEKTSDFKTAAAYYEKFVDRVLGAPDDKKKDAKKKAEVAKKAEPKAVAKELGEEELKVADALYNAALWNEGLGNFDHAIALYRRYIERFPGKKDLPDIAFNIGLIYEKQKNLKEAAHSFKAFVDQYGKDVTPSKVYYAKYREMLALRELKQDKDAQAKIDELVKSFEKLPAADKAADQTVNAYAHARFLALEPMWREYTSVKFDNVGRLRKDLTQKLKLIGDPDRGTGITGEYAKVLAVGSGDWGIAALTRIGQAYQDFAKNLIDSPDPRGLDEDQLAMYRGELENRAFPLEEKAIEAYEKALTKGVELAVYNEWTLKAQDEINRFKPGAFFEVHEVPFLGAERFATSLAAITETGKAPAAAATPAEKPAATPAAK